jgi:hypothetical protein
MGPGGDAFGPVSMLDFPMSYALNAVSAGGGYPYGDPGSAMSGYAGSPPISALTATGGAGDAPFYSYLPGILTGLANLTAGSKTYVGSGLVTSSSYPMQPTYFQQNGGTAPVWNPFSQTAPGQANTLHFSQSTGGLILLAVVLYMLLK